MTQQVIYAFLEDVKRAIDVTESARDDDQILRALQSSSRAVERDCGRARFIPWDGTLYFDWPNFQHTYSWKLYFDQHDLVSASQITTGGTALTVSDYFLEPRNDGPPYRWLEINLAQSAAFAGANTRQRSIAITGTWSYSADTVPVGTLVGSVSSSATSVVVSDSSTAGIGAVLIIDSERMIVTGRGAATTGQTITADLTASTAATSVGVADGTQIHRGEVLTVDAERMLTVDVVGNTVVVKRAFDGSVLTAHTTGATVYAPRTLTVVRAERGTSGTTHSDGAAVTRFDPPALVRDLTVAYTLDQFQGEQSGYARVSGGGEKGDSLYDLRCRAVQAFGRQARSGVI